MRNIILLLFTLAVYTPVLAQSLTVEVSGLKSTQGQLLVALYNSSDDFPKEGKEWRGEVVSLIDEEVKAVFDKVSPGNYAVAVYHDEDSNNELNTNAVGFPLESYGFSRNKFGAFGAPPRFSIAAVEVKDDVVINIKLR